MGVALVGLLGALALPVLSAGAQTATGDCVITVPPPATVTAGSQVTISGTAPDGVTVVLFANGSAAVPTPNTTDVTSVVVSGSPTGPFELRFTPTATVTLSVNFVTAGANAYTAVCATTAGRTTFPVSVGANEAAKTTPAAQALAFTGSSDTPSYVLIGIAAIVVGGVLVVAARRRKQVS
jgi:LPXTG-motif cell wall-anchored protein